MREISSPLDGFASPFGRRRDLLNATAIARLLFSDNEPGFFYDFDDWSTLFQDTAGTQPVTAANQGVALALDKRLGLELGPELVTNGGFDEGISGWSVVGSSTTKQVTWTGSALELSASTTGTCVASGDITPLVSGRTYQVSGDCLLYTESLSGVFFGDGAQSVGVIGGVGKFRFIVTAGAGHSKINFGRVSVGVNTLVQLQVDNISVRELKGNHATQATTAARPLTVIHPDGGVRNLLDRTEEFDNAVWTKNGMTITPNSGVAPDGFQSADLAFPTTSTGNAPNQTISCFVKSSGFSWVAFGTNTNDDARAYFNLSGNGSVGAVGSFLTNATIVPLVNDWYRISVTTTSSTSGSAGWAIWATNGDAPFSVTPSGTSGIFIWGAQLELGSTATPYQKRVNFLDVTEAGKRSIRRLYFNGTSHFMTTPTITPNTDKAQVFAGVRKLSDAAIGFIAQLPSAPVTGIGFPRSASTLGPFLQSGAVELRGANIAAPASAVLAGAFDGAGATDADKMKLRTNAAPDGTFSASGVTVSLSPLAIEIGRRNNNTSFFNGYIDQLITRFGTNLDTGAIETTEKYVSTKVPELVAASEVTWNASTDTYTQNLVGLGR
jgi:hypothetical protein